MPINSTDNRTIAPEKKFYQSGWNKLCIHTISLLEVIDNIFSLWFRFSITSMVCVAAWETGATSLKGSEWYNHHITISHHLWSLTPPHWSSKFLLRSTPSHRNPIHGRLFLRHKRSFVQVYCHTNSHLLSIYMQLKTYFITIWIYQRNNNKFNWIK